VEYRAVNSCILFLASLDGKQVLTVEDLRASGGTLHPVQQAMVNGHGSQCGFCTPGIVMSLAGLSESGAVADRAAIDNALSGNLCRCTGYDDIAVAVERMPADKAGEGLASAETRTRLEAIAPRGVLSLGTGDRRFLAPTTLDELTRILAENPDAQLLAGGTDLALRVTKQLEDPATLVYLGNIAALRGAEVTDDAVMIGAATPLTDAGAVLGDCFPDLRMLFRRFGSVQIRNAGTLGGNIANASPVGDTLPALLVLNAEVTLRGGDGARTLPLESFFRGYRETALTPGEFLERIRVPRPSGTELRVYKIAKRRDQDISTLCGAFALVLNGAKVAGIRVAFGGMAEIPRRAPACEAALLGNPWTEGTVEAAVTALEKDYSPITDVRGSARYRSLCAGNLLRKFLVETTTGRPLTVFADPEHAS